MTKQTFAIKAVSYSDYPLDVIVDNSAYTLKFTDKDGNVSTTNVKDSAIEFVDDEIASRDVVTVLFDSELTLEEVKKSFCFPNLGFRDPMSHKASFSLMSETLVPFEINAV